MTRRRRRQQGSRLFALYVLASLVPILAIGAVAVRADANTGREFGLDWGRAQSAVIEQMVVAPALRAADLSLGLDTSERGRLRVATDLPIFNGTVSHLRLLSFNGTIEFSDDGSVTDPVPVNDRLPSGRLPPGARMHASSTTPDGPPPLPSGSCNR